MNQVLNNKTNITSSVQSYDPSAAEKDEPSNNPSNHWEIRTQEQEYAFLSDKKIKENNYP